MAAVKTKQEQGLPVSQGSPGPHLQRGLQDPSVLVTAPVLGFQG